MLPLLPFVAGAAAGAFAVKLWRTDKARTGLDQAQEKLRQATVSSLTAIEHSSAAMRDRLSPPAAPVVKEAPAARSAAKTSAKTSAKTAAKKPAAKAKPAAKPVKATKKPVKAVKPTPPTGEAAS